MKIKPAFLAIVVSVLVGSVYNVVQAKACGDSFYCYGDTAESLATTSTRPPPIPPPNTLLRRLQQQRNQQHIAIRNRTTSHVNTNRSVPAITPTPRATRSQHTDEDDGISVIAIPARPNPPQVNRVQPPPPPVPLAACRPAHLAAMNRAESLERLGAIAAKRNDRAMSLRFFGEAKQIRVTAPPC